MLKKNIFKTVFVFIILIFIQEIIIPEKQIDFNGFPAFKIEKEKVLKLLQNLKKDIKTTTMPNCTFPKWTILIHFALDNNLSNNTKMLHDFEVLESIEAKDENNNLDIVVLFDGLNGKPYEDGYYHVTGQDFKDDLVIPAAEINSGSIDEVEDFIDWAVSTYPGDRYFYSILNHGYGFEDTSLTGTELSEKELWGKEIELSESDTILGAGSDVTNSDVLTHFEFGKIFEYFNLITNKKIEIFYINACRMGGIELAYELKDYVNFMLASQIALPLDAWAYQPLELLINNPGISALCLGREYCNSAYDFFTKLDKSSYTLTLTYLPAVAYLKSFLECYADLAIQSIQRDANKANYFDLAANQRGMSYTIVTTDIGNYLEAIQLSNNMDLDVRIQAYLTKIIYDFTIQYHINVKQPETTGLTIFHNHWLIYDQYPIELYKDLLKFGKNNLWVNYLELMESLAIKEDEYEPDNDFNSATNLSLSEIKQEHNIYPIRDKDFFVFDLNNLEDDMHIKIETYPSNDIRYTPMIITLYDQDEKIICSDLNNIIFKPKYVGKYYIKTKSKSNSTMGEYIIDAIICEEPEVDQYEYDDDFDTGNILFDPDGVIQNHTLHINGDEDFIKIEYTQASSDEFSILARIISLYPYSIYLYDEYYNLLAESQYVFNNDSIIDEPFISINLYPISKPGIYYLKIAQDIKDADYLMVKETYSLEIIKRKPDIYEPNNSPELAKEYYINSGSVMLQFHNINDEDWLFFTALSNDIITLSLQAERNNFNNILEGYIYHESDLEHEIGYIENTPGEQFQCPLDGKYYIKIKSMPDFLFCYENYIFEITR